jgi:hypothetical protein
VRNANIARTEESAASFRHRWRSAETRILPDSPRRLLDPDLFRPTRVPRDWLIRRPNRVRQWAASLLFPRRGDCWDDTSRSESETSRAAFVMRLRGERVMRALRIGVRDVYEW